MLESCDPCWLLLILLSDVLLRAVDSDIRMDTAMEHEGPDEPVPMSITDDDSDVPALPLREEGGQWQTPPKAPAPALQAVSKARSVMPQPCHAMLRCDLL